MTRKYLSKAHKDECLHDESSGRSSRPPQLHDLNDLIRSAISVMSASQTTNDPSGQDRVSEGEENNGVVHGSTSQRDGGEVRVVFQDETVEPTAALVKTSDGLTKQETSESVQSGTVKEHKYSMSLDGTESDGELRGVKSSHNQPALNRSGAGSGGPTDRIDVKTVVDRKMHAFEKQFLTKDSSGYRELTIGRGNKLQGNDQLIDSHLDGIRARYIADELAKRETIKDD